MAKQLDKMLTNQGVRKRLQLKDKQADAFGLLADGKSTFMFSAAAPPVNIGRIDAAIASQDKAYFWDKFCTFAFRSVTESVRRVRTGESNDIIYTQFERTSSSNTTSHTGLKRS